VVIGRAPRPARRTVSRAPTRTARGRRLGPAGAALLLAVCGRTDAPPDAALPDDLEIGFDIAAPATEPVRGMVVVGPDGVGFRPCGSVREFPLDDETGELRQAWQYISGQPFGEMYVELEVRVDPGPRRGFAGTADRVVAVAVRRAAWESPGCDDDVFGFIVRARGNEPFWFVEVTADAIALRTPERLEPLSFPYASPADSVGWRVFDTARADGARLRLAVREERCVDDMSGEWFSYRAGLSLDGGPVAMGCAMEGWP
jgi:uncharacterized membrane protein